MRKSLFVSLFVGIMTFSTIIISAQNPAEKPKNQKKETTTDKIFKGWVSNDVAYIITAEEKKVIGMLTTNEERENFIENFWRRRDPDPDTEENEYRDEFYERIAYANEKFTSGIPGWKTDRGRIYISFGKPDSVESHPSGGSYDRPSYEGGGSTTTYPFETWFYRHLDNVGDGLEIEFVDPTGTGEYRIARNANEKDALLYVPGAGATLNEQLGLSNKANRITGINTANNMRDQDLPFNKINMINSLFTAPRSSFGPRMETVDTGVVLNEPTIDFNMQIDYFRQTEEKTIITLTIQSQNKELSFQDRGGIQTAKMNIAGKITKVTGKRIATFQDVVATTATTEELAKNQTRSSIYQKAVVLESGGTYKVNVIIRDVDSGKIGVKNIGFTVPKYDAGKISTSTLILASRLYGTTDRNIGESFIIGGTKVIPNISAKYKKGQEVGIYLQVYNAGIDQTTLKPAANVEYILTKNGKEVFRQMEDWTGLSDAGQRLTLAKLIPTTQLNSGEYELKIKIKDTVNNQLLEPSAKFTIE